MPRWLQENPYTRKVSFLLLTFILIYRGGIAVVWLGQRIKPAVNGTGAVGEYVAMK
jgi:hypothetical protein